MVPLKGLKEFFKMVVFIYQNVGERIYGYLFLAIRYLG